MSDVSVTKHKPQQTSDLLRRDLHSIVVDGRRRAYRIVVDEVSGRFARVSENVWQSLVDGQHDPQLWQEARAAGWTRERTEEKRRTFTPLYFRIPVGSVDGIAARLAPHSGIVFSVVAVLIWTAVITVAAVLALSHGPELFASLSSLQLFLRQSNPLWLATLFVASKVAHELSHAVMCRRMGSRCGSVGLLMLCGVPCPYCDVTDVWRQPSAARRAAVMLAGIYVELIIAAVATFVWVGATDPAIRLHALNLMVVCGISIIVFNANPLMRHDGYYVLSDLIGSTNLRQEARDAFRRVVTTRIAGPEYGDTRQSSTGSCWLASFHAASTFYRLGITVAIATLFLGIAEYLSLRPLAIGIVVLAMTAAAVGAIGRTLRIVHGADRWSHVPVWRRGGFTLLVMLLVVSVLFVPLPRYRTALGRVDTALASSVFLPNDAVVEAVGADFGEVVEPGELLVSLRSESFAIQQAKLQGQLRVAKLRSSLSRRVALDRSADTSDAWKTLQAAEDAVAIRLASVQQRMRETDVRAAMGGVVLPAQPFINTSDSTAAPSLRDRVGTFADARKSWCRISHDGAVHAVLVIDARDRTNVDVGVPVTIGLSQSPEDTFTSTVVSVSAIEEDQPSVTRRAACHVLCPLPAVKQDELLRWLGKECKGVFHFPNRTLAADMGDWISRWLGG
jgi:putative peptide zinc metalloprotease protein